MRKLFTSLTLALFLTAGGATLTASSAEAHCGKCAHGPKAAPCDKCKNKKSCDCQKAKGAPCDKCKKAGKKSCNCKH